MIWGTACGEGVMFLGPPEIPASEQLSANEIQQRIDVYKQHMLNARLSINHLKESHYKLQRYLLGGADKGCYLKQRLSTLTMKASGQQNKPVLVKRSRRLGELKTQGDPSSLTVELAPRVNTTVLGDRLASGATLNFTQQLHDLFIADIQYLKIIKNGSGIKINSMLEGRGCGFFWLAPCEYFSYYETHVWHINHIELWSHQTLIYQNHVGQTFHRNSSQWMDQNLAENPLFAKMIRRDDCQTRQPVEGLVE
ncbi:MAG: hypothetical protein OXC40_01795 [Proteobacteria bacterium]|nr:hypothetical protein [Pseudomonadota bacterium]